MIDETEEVLYALILERESPGPVRDIGRIVARHLEIPLPDAVAQVRYGGGLIAEALSESEAGALSSALDEIEVKARAVEAEEWLSAPRGYRISTLSFGQEALEACLSTGRKFLIPKEDFFGLHLYGLVPAGEEPGTTGRETTGRRAARRRTATPRETPLSVPLELSGLTARGRQLLRNLSENEIPGMELHLTLYCPPEVGPLRVRRDDFNFACLGDARLEHSLDNFILLLEKLVDTLPNAWNRTPVEEFLADMDPLRILYFKKEEAQNFDRWMLYWVRVEARARNEHSGA